MNIRCQLILDELARHRTQFEHLCHDLSDRELRAIVPGSHWTVKHYIAHLATIDGLIAHNFSLAAGLQAPPPATPYPDPFDIDEWNESAVERVAGWSVDDMLIEAATHRERMALAISHFKDADLDRVIPYGGDRKSLGPLPKSQVRFGGLLWAIAVHDPTHTRDLLRALPERADQPWIEEWLGSVSESLIPDGVKEQRV
ncbi:MAG: DinB family protein [Dehalococcoidia bacterium]